MKSKLTFLIVCLMFMSCQKDVIPEQGVNEETNVSFVSKTMAEKIALNVFNKDPYLQTRADIPVTKQIEESFTMADDEDETYLHVVNYKDGGFVLIAGDMRLEPLLAYSENGYFGENSTSYPEGLLVWLSEIQQQTKYARDNDLEIPDVLQYRWNDLAGLITKGISPDGDEGSICDLYTPNNVRTGPLLTTSWEQGSGYNNALSIMSCATNGHVLAGCVPLAIAQLMKYNQYPSSFQWSLMPDATTSSYTQNLLLDIHQKIGASNLTYNCTSTSVSSSYNTANLLKNQYGYSSASQGSYGSATVKSELLGYHPVLITAAPSSGAGHMWVCDGVHAYDYCANETIWGMLYFHYNWGWGGTSDGWYGTGNFNTGTYNFTSNQKMVYNIRHN
jgi:hypothetical protein